MLVLTDDDAKTVQNVVHSLQVLETISPVITNNDIKEKVCIIAIYLNISPSFSPPLLLIVVFIVACSPFLYDVFFYCCKTHGIKMCRFSS